MTERKKAPVVHEHSQQQRQQRKTMLLQKRQPKASSAASVIQSGHAASYSGCGTAYMLPAWRYPASNPSAEALLGMLAGACRRTDNLHVKDMYYDGDLAPVHACVAAELKSYII